MDTKYKEIVEEQREFFNTNITLDYSFRYNALNNLKKTIIKYENDILNALQVDLNKSSYEAYMTEIGVVYNEINFAIRNLKKWMKPKKVKTPLYMFRSKSYIIYEPYGISLIISPWNYPFQLALMPLVGAIGAGNCAIIKPSEFSVCTSGIIKKIINETFDKQYCEVILGDYRVNEALLNNKFDFIFFTGSTKVGKIVSSIASKNLTPICLELGGKSPCIVDSTADLQMAARRIVFGKFLNAGQTCVAPDYVIIEKNVKEPFIDYLKFYINKYYGTALENPNYPKIISSLHFRRLISLSTDEQIVFGGQTKDNQYIEPTIIDNVTFSSQIMEEEIFGPLLPIIAYESLEEVVRYLQSSEKPLALYLFTDSIANKNLILKYISFGGGCVNDTIMHLSNPHLPFGGVGQSGMGQYHGKYSFELFSHQKAINEKLKGFDTSLRYPPYNDKKLKILKRLMN